MRWGMSPGMRFGLRFFACLMLFSILFWAFSVHEHLGPVQQAIATLSALGARLAGGEALAQGHDVVVKTMVMNVNHECTGIFVCMLFASFVLAYPARWSARLAGFAIGIPLLLSINIFRLATLARLVEVYPDAFFYFHEYVWQGVFMVFVLVGALAWAERFG